MLTDEQVEHWRREAATYGSSGSIPAQDIVGAMEEIQMHRRARGITLTREEAEEISIILSAYMPRAVLPRSASRAAILRESLRARLHPPGPGAETAQGAPGEDERPH